MATRIVLVRHGETEWTRTGRHTGRTDVPLTDAGRHEAEGLRRALARWTFARVLSSPLGRTLETARRAGFGDRVEVTDDLLEWDYGDYDGRTTADIRATRPGWSLWSDGVPGGESADEVGARVDRVVGSLEDVEGDVVLFAHGHVLRVLAARWLGLPPTEGRLLALDPGTVSVLGHEREARVVLHWNNPPS
ncbi:MAG: hypothetical protein QOI99_198 [Actinomycetota bacterium]|nr:hypothetical protein [Actinomycetota bacterium]